MSITQPSQVERRGHISPARSPRYDTIDCIDGDALVIFDTHVPCHDAELIEEACDVAKSLDVDQVVIGGDLMSFDQYRPRTGVGKQHARRVQDDLNDAGLLLRELRGIFQRVVVILGNHDRWGIDAQSGHMDADFWLAQMAGIDHIDGIRILTREHLIIMSDHGQYLICHGTGGRPSNPLALPTSLAELYQMHVLVGHLHRSAQGYSRCGRYTVASVGCAADPRRFEYQHIKPHPFPRQQQGYAVIARGELHLFSRPLQ